MLNQGDQLKMAARAEVHVQKPYNSPNDVLIDLGHPLVNRVVDGFIKAGGVRECCSLSLTITMMLLLRPLIQTLCQFYLVWSVRELVMGNKGRRHWHKICAVIESMIAAGGFQLIEGKDFMCGGVMRV